ncbi:MAG: hypothetical protein ABI295_09950 [Xanthomarina sp.]
MEPVISFKWVQLGRLYKSEEIIIQNNYNFTTNNFTKLPVISYFSLILPHDKRTSATY